MRKKQINTIPKFENFLDYYWIYDNGQVWSDYKKDFMKPDKHYSTTELKYKWLNGKLDKEPYYILRVGLRENFKEQPTLIPIHRLVAEAFIPNPNNLPEINHIDKNTSNNDYTNLEWIEKEKNIKIGLSKPIWRCDKNTHERLEYFNSLAEAEQAGYSRPNIIAVCKGRRKSANKFFWEYEK